MITAIAFYIFSSMVIASALMVIAARNPVHSVLFLILAFFNSAGLFVLLGAEFLAMILVVVYVGAVAVLFMFVVMMLDINFVELRQGFLQYMPIGGLVGLILLAELIAVFGSWVFSENLTSSDASTVFMSDSVTNTHALGKILYTDYLYLFEAAGIVLLIAMIGAIVLTHRRRTDVHKQVITAQLKRTKQDTIEVRTIEPGEGI